MSLFSAWCNNHGWLGSRSHFPFYCMVIIVSVTIILRNIFIHKNVIIVEHCLLFMTVLSLAHHLFLQIKVFLIPEHYTCHVFCSMLPSSSTYRNTFIISMNVAIVFIRRCHCDYDILIRGDLQLSEKEKEAVGWRCKRLIDYGRAFYLRRCGLHSDLKVYIDSQQTPENVVLIATPSEKLWGWMF